MKPIFRFLNSIPLACAAALFVTPASRAQSPVSTWAQSYGVGNYDANGNPGDGQLYGSGYDEPDGIAPMPDGGVVVALQLDLPSSQHDYAHAGALAQAAIVRYGANGAILWQRDLGGHTVATRILADGQGNVFVAGGNYDQGAGLGVTRPFVAKFDPNGTLLWQSSLGAAHFTTGPYGPADLDAGDVFGAMSLTADGSVVVGTVLATPQYNFVHGVPLIAKFNANGALVFVRTFEYASPNGGSGSLPASAVCQSVDGTRYLMLVAAGTPGPDKGSPMTAVLTDAAGAIIGQRTFYGVDYSGEVPAEVFATADGGFVTYSRLPSGGLVRKLGSDLLPILEEAVVLPPNNYGQLYLTSSSCALTADGGFLISGRINGTYLGTVLGYDLRDGASDLALVKLNAGGFLQGIYQVGGRQNEDFTAGGVYNVECHAVETSDGGFAFTAPTLSYATAPNASNFTDIWVAKTDARGRVQNFPDVLGSLPTSSFNEFNYQLLAHNPIPSVGGGIFGAPPDGYSGTDAAVSNLAPVDINTFTGINKPNVQVQAAAFTGLELPPTVGFTATSPVDPSTGGIWTFTAFQPGTAAGLSVRVQLSSTPLFENSWTDLPGGGRMQGDGHGHWTLATSNVPYSTDYSFPVYYRVFATAGGHLDSASMFARASTHAAFFATEVPLSQGVYYLEFSNAGIFGYYEYLSDPHFIYHFDMGFEYVFDAADGNAGVYLYDFASNDFFYTSPTFPFPYLYDFNLQAFLYYYPDPTNPQRYNTKGTRYFYNFSTGQVITK